MKIFFPSLFVANAPVEAGGAEGDHASARLIGVLDDSLAAKDVIQEFRPFSSSLEWELGLRYYQRRGSDAFIHDATPIPYAINNDGNFAAHAED